MKKLIIFFISILASSFCVAQTNLSDVKLQEIHLPDTSIKKFVFISKSDAVGVLENQVILKDSIWKVVGKNWTFKCLYRTTVKDSASAMPYELYYDFENYPDSSGAKRFFELMKIENAKSGVVNDLDRVGDEGFVARDILNNPFLMIRKGRAVFKFKTYKMKSSSSYERLLKVSRKIVEGA